MPGSARAVHRGHVDLRNSPAKMRQAKGAAPRFSTSLCPVSILESPVTNRRQQRTACNASLFPRPTSSIMHTHADWARSSAPRDLRDRARANRPRCRWKPEVIFDLPQAVFPQQRDARRRMSHLKNLMTVRCGSIASIWRCPRRVRFSPVSDQTTDIAACLKGANYDPAHCNKTALLLQLI
jgi:hypothetical protein